MLAINFEKIFCGSFRRKLVNEVLLAGSVVQSESEEKGIPTFFQYFIIIYIVKIDSRAAGQLSEFFDVSFIIIIIEGKP